LINRKEEIKKKGFKISFTDSANNEKVENPFVPVDFSKIKIGAKTLDDAVVDLGSYKEIDRRLAKKENILKSLYNNNYAEMREISNFYFETSGIYSRLCKYMAYMYRYDWMVTPYINEDTASEKDENTALIDFYKILLYLDNSELKKTFGEIALKVVKNGCYYGYLVANSKRIIIQELPVNYCRSRFSSNGRPAIEFNMRYFDLAFKDTTQRVKMLKLFPSEFKKGYMLYKEGKLPPQFSGDIEGWYLLDVNSTIKFNVNGTDSPMFMSVIPAIIDLDEAKELDKKKMAQELLKIIIQKMPLDKNGDLVFDVDEAQQLHNNAVNMLKRAIGIDVLTTFADVDVADMSDNRSTASTDDLERVERSVYNEAGVSQMQFNTDGNIALEKSILNDAASMYNLILQFEGFMNDMIEKYNKKPKKYYYRAQILTTTIYNYQEMAKLYKEQMQVGFSKMLPGIALGQAQSTILANAFFENDILDLVNVFIPPMMSSTMNSDVLNRVNQQTRENRNNGGTNGSDNVGGRPEKSDDEKSEKTIANKESQS